MVVCIGAKEMFWTIVRTMLVDAAPFVASADGRALGIAELVGQTLYILLRKSSHCALHLHQLGLSVLCQLNEITEFRVSSILLCAQLVSLIHAVHLLFSLQQSR